MADTRTQEASTRVEPKLTTHRVAIENLVPDPTNPRAHGDANLAAIEASLRRFGQAEPLVVQLRTRRLIAGHGRLEAMRRLGWTECDVVELDVDDRTARALGAALNRTAELAEWDEQKLGELLAELKEAGELDGVGFDDQDVDALIAELDGAPQDLQDPGPGEPPDEPVSRLGDLWILGKHRLLCGDSTSAEDMTLLMGAEKAALLATDPPYLVDYQGGNHPQSWSNKPDVKDKHWDDYVDPKTGREFFSTYLRVALPHCIDRVPVYQWHATRRQVIVEEAWKENGLLVHQTLIWVKARPVLTRCLYMWQHEPCFFGWPEGFMPDDTRRPPPNERTVWEVDQIGELDGIHPTQKPLALFERPIAFHTRPGEIVLEPFSGSGTQLIAAEKLGRRCRAMEIAPAYVDVAIRRWEEASGKAARHATEEKTFAELAADRFGGAGR